jgi:uncharacterized protein GlcG (DUF336 family)
VIPVTSEFAEAEVSSSSAMQNGASGRGALRPGGGVGIGLEMAKVITAVVRAVGKERGLKPLTVVVLDAGGHVVSAGREDGASNNRFEIAYGKAYGALALGKGSRSLMARAEQQSCFIAAAAAIAGRLVPVPGACWSRMRRGRCSVALASPVTRPTTTSSPRSPGSRPLPWYRSQTDRPRAPRSPFLAIPHQTAPFIA